MNISSYINQDAVEKLLSNQGNVENVSNYLCEIKNIEPANISKSFVPEVYINRKDEIEEVISFFNEPGQRVLLASGIQGTGKSALLRSIITLADEPVLIFWYECSKITNLDDLLLSFCAYFDKKKSKDQLSKGKSFISVDERLISNLKTLDRPLIVVLDSFEHLVTTDFKIENEELKFFFNFLLDNKFIKLVLCGQRLPTSDMDYDDDYVAVVKTSGLPESDSVKLLRESGMIASNSTLSQLYRHSRGYPWVLLLTASISTEFNIEPEKIVKSMSYYEDSFESYLLKLAYKSISDDTCKVLDYLSVFRHPVNVQLLSDIDKSFKDLDANLNYLVKLRMVKSSGRRFSVNNAVRRYVYDLIPVTTRREIHNTISKFYSNEISKKLAQRTIRISRKLLYSEQYYHNMSSTKLAEAIPEKPKTSENNLKYNYTVAEPAQDIVNPGDIDPQYIHLINQAQSEKPETVKFPLEDLAEKVFSADEKEKKEVVNLDGFELELSSEELEMIGDSQDETVEEATTKFSQIPDDSNVQISIQEERYNDLDLELSVDVDEAPESESIDMIDSLRFVANGYANEGKHNIAIERYNEALDLSEKIGNQVEKAKTLLPLADSYMYLKDYDKSIECYEQAKAIYDEIHDYTDIPAILANMGKVYSECYKHENALKMYTQVLNMPQEFVANQVRASVFMGMGEIFDYHQRFNEALNYYFQALRTYEEISDLSNISILYSRIALIYDDLEDYEKAIVNYQRSLELDKQLGKKQHYAATLSNIAAVYDETGRKSQSLNYYKQSMIIDKELENNEGLYKTLGRVGTIYVELGNAEKAYTYYQQELEVAKIAKNPFWIAMAYIDIGDLYYYTKNYEKATKCFMISQRVISKSISTDSKEKIERRLRKMQEYIPKDSYEKIRKQVHNK